MADTEHTSGLGFNRADFPEACCEYVIARSNRNRGRELQSGLPRPRSSHRVPGK